MLRRLLFASSILLAALAVTAPFAVAAPTFRVQDIQFLSTDDDALHFVPQKGPVTVRITLNNTGVVAVNETITVRVQVTTDAGTKELDINFTRRVDVEPGRSVDIDYRWSATRALGNHTILVGVEGGITQSVTTTFEVTPTAVVAGNVVERVLTFYWFFGAFVVAAILFFVVLAARKA